MKFVYRGTLDNGEATSGSVDAADENEAFSKLADRGITVEKISVSALGGLDKHWKELKSKYKKVKLEDLIIFTRQFATLFSAGIPMVTILERLQSQTQSKKLAEKTKDILADVEAGSPLSVAFGKHRDVFSPLYINMLNVGEEGGVLDIVLGRLTTILETDLETKNRIKTATRYPKMVISAIVVAFIILLTFVIPKFVGIFRKFDTELPLPTKILIWLNSFFQNYWWLLIIIVIGLVFGYKKVKNTKKGKDFIDKYSLQVPVLGNLMHKIYVSRIARILGLLYKSGIGIITSFEIVSEVTGNNILKSELLDIRDRVSGGTNIASAFVTSSYFPQVVSDMIAAGEETGQLDNMLFKISDYYDEEINYSINTLSSALEPILLVFIAGMVLILALGVFLPMWDMIKVFQ
ncbi:type II secretion system F family protein [Flexistipes sinusarabici]|uniref:type II secretion system F family protein n=1 Tax=Flexistipes sinusarabici TaxID=2352 RepID=UPI00235555E7|nr:type II secretion system F family protein [Flexistipes sinusarabici]